MAVTTMNDEQDTSSSHADPDFDYTSSETTPTDVYEKGDEQLAAKETQAVNAGKVLVFGVLIMAAILMGWLTYWFTSLDEQDTFETSVGCHLLSYYQGLIFTERLTPRDLSCS
jgi:hypothetical protein